MNYGTRRKIGAGLNYPRVFSLNKSSYEPLDFYRFCGKLVSRKFRSHGWYSVVEVSRHIREEFVRRPK